MAEPRVMRAVDKKLHSALRYFFSNISPHLGLVVKGEFKEGAEASGIYQLNREILVDRYSRGWTDAEIRNAFEQAKTDKRKTATLSDILPAIPPSQQGEDWSLLKTDERYFHGALKVFSPPVLSGRKVIDSGSVGRIPEFTLRQLVDYYRDHLRPQPFDRKEAVTVLRYFVQGQSLDEILFAIDIWQEEDPDSGPDPWALRRFLPAARKEIFERRSRGRLSG